jgi:hypothetical protein
MEAEDLANDIENRMWEQRLGAPRVVDDPGTGDQGGIAGDPMQVPPQPLPAPARKLKQTSGVEKNAAMVRDACL